MYPKVSIIWLNYNSMKNIDVIKSSLQAVCDLDYPNFEFIAVDNGSNDGSYEVIQDFLSKKNINHKIIKLEKNLGFCGGNNVGYKAMDAESKYLVLLNNDCVPEKDSLSNLVEFMEQHSEVGACQGVILNLQDENKIDTAGDYISEFLMPHLFLKGDEKNSVPLKPYLISYADGCFCVYRIEIIKKVMKDRLFYDEFFSYFDDNFLGLKIWNAGYKVVAIPKIVGKHWRSMSFNYFSSYQEYLSIRNHVAISFLISNSLYKNFLLRNLYYKIYLYTKNRYKNPERAKNIKKAIKDGKKLGKFLIKRREETIDIKKIPRIKLNFETLLRITFRSIASKRSLGEELTIYAGDYIKRNIKSFYFE